MTADMWWRDAVVYQIYVRSFADSGTDGVGDLAGISDRLDHVADLGVDAIWLTPFYPSPQRDHGYDVADYFDVDPEYGTLADIDRLIAGCHQRGLRFLADVVPNHCSSEHAWFREALAAAPGSAARARFYFRDGRGEHGELPPNNWKAMFGGSAWTRVADGQWYLHSFSPWQPDFDWDNEEVASMFDDVMRFWFDRGVDGFRVDAVSHLGKAAGLPDAPEPPAGTPETGVVGYNPYMLHWPSAHDVWRRWRAVADQYEREHSGRQLVSVAEAYTPGKIELLLDYVRPDEFHQAFSFDLLLAPWNAAIIRQAIDATYATFSSVGASMTWTFNNHDTQRSVTRFGRADATDASSWTGSNLIYSAAPVDVPLGTERARAAAVLLAALPGSIYLYQGEELGLPEVLDIPPESRTDPIFVRTEGREIGRDGCRVPIPWTTDATSGYGFSTGPAHTWLPQPSYWGSRSVAAERANEDSMLELYRLALALRKELLAGDETLTWKLPDRPDVVAFGRRDILVVLNPTGTAIDVGLPRDEKWEIVVSSRSDHEEASVVPADTCVWLRARGVWRNDEPGTDEEASQPASDGSIHVTS